VSESTYTVADVAHMAGVKTRTIQFWTMNNVLICDPETRHGGPGVRRRYEFTECVVAAVIGVLSELSVPVGRLSAAAEAIRLCLNLLPNQGAEKRKQAVKEATEKQDLLQESLDDWIHQQSERNNSRLSKKDVENKVNVLSKELNYHPGSFKDVDRWHALWTAIEEREETYILMHYDNSKGWSLTEVGSANFVFEVSSIKRMMPNSWGAIFIINTLDLLRRFP